MFENLRNLHGERLDATFHPGDGSADVVVAIGHGVTSHKDRPWLLALSEALQRAGVASLRFSFAGNGASEGNYEDATISKEVEDLGCVVESIRLSGARPVYAGHSMGGAVGLLRASLDPRLVALVSLAGMVHVDRFMRTQFGHLVPGQDVMLGKSRCPLGQSLLDDAASYGDLLQPAAVVRIPWLLVHGSADELVPLQESVDVRSAAAGRPDLVVLDGVDHRFSGHEQPMADAVVAWLRQQRLAQPEA